MTPVFILVSTLSVPPARKLMVYVNPFSGSGKAEKIYEKYVKPMFAEAEIQHDLIKTGLCNHNSFFAVPQICSEMFKGVN